MTTEHSNAASADVSGPRDQIAPMYTPGPWRWWTSNSFWRLSSDATRKDGDVLYGYVMRDGVASVQVKEADARLIALAPELVEALEQCYTTLGDNSNQWKGRHTVDGQRLLARLRDLISEATGREAQDVQDDYCNRYLSKL